MGKNIHAAVSRARSLIQVIVLGLSATGEVFGMQTTVVNPPAAAARAPDCDRFLVSETGLAQMDMHVDQAGRNNEALCASISAISDFRFSDCGLIGDPAVDDHKIADFIALIRRIDDAAVANDGSHSCRDPSAEIQNGHAHGQTVGHLIENDALLAIGDFAVDLDAAIDRAGMHDQAIGLQQFRALFR